MGQKNSKPKPASDELVDATVFTIELLEAETLDAKGKKLRRIRGIGSTVDDVNRNQRKYPKEVTEEAITRLKAEKKGQKYILYGESGHPIDKAQWADLPHETVIGWDKIYLDYPHVRVEGDIFPTDTGGTITTLLENGAVIALSQRGRGLSEYKNGVEIVEKLTLLGYDLVMQPGDINSTIEVFERLDTNRTQGGTETMDPKDKEKGTETTDSQGTTSVPVAAPPASQPAIIIPQDAINEVLKARIEALNVPTDVADNLYEQVLMLKPATINEAKQHLTRLYESYKTMLAGATDQQRAVVEALGLKPGQDPVAAISNLRETNQNMSLAEQQREVTKKLEELAESGEYSPIVREQFRGMVMDLTPGTPEDAVAQVDRIRPHFDKMESQLRLAAQGLEKRGIKVMGPVFEIETGLAEYLKPTAELVEKLDLYKHRGKTDLAKIGQRQTFSDNILSLYLDMYDRQNKEHLIAEARRYEEALTSTELNLPYTVARTIVIEAIPAIVSFGIFDVGPTDSMSTRLYFERYEEETGASVSVVRGDALTFEPVLGQWVDIPNVSRIRFGTAVIEYTVGDVVRVEGTDYVLNYTDGQIYAITGGGISNSQSHRFVGTYDVIRQGEDTEIQRAKTVLDYQTVDVKPDRLATKITDESIKYARTQLGWDAIARSVSNLAREVTRKIDSNLFAMALQGVLLVPNNGVGTVTLSSDTPDVMARLTGQARVKVTDRGYEPNAVILSTGNADWLSNWENFTAAGKRPDSDLDAAGYVGRLKGLPVFESSVFSAGHGIVCDRQLVMHRIYQAMIAKGPYPTYGPNRHLTGSEEYYVEEYNASAAPQPNKGSYFLIA